LRVPLVTNVMRTRLKPRRARSGVIRQVTAPVRWEESVRLLIDGAWNTFVRSGPGEC